MAKKLKIAEKADVIRVTRENDESGEVRETVGQIPVYDLGDVNLIVTDDAKPLIKAAEERAEASRKARAGYARKYAEGYDRIFKRGKN